jgi:hypothetical protein
MSLHDAYARMTPFEIAFPEPQAIERLLSAIDEEASSRGVDPSLVGVFLTLGSVDDFVRALQPPGGSSSATAQYGALVFQAVHFARAGRPVYLLGTDVVRRIVEEAPAAEAVPPTPAGYVQLPQHLLWMDGGDGGAPESVDGIFWVATGDGELHVLPVTGVLPDGPGFRALPLPEASLADAEAWLHADMRETGADFASALPGHELDGLYAVRTAGEVLKLLARFFAQVAASSAAGEKRPAVSGTPERGPRPSALPYTRVGLVG